jgi:hypothetical protein
MEHLLCRCGSGVALRCAASRVLYLLCFLIL